MTALIEYQDLAVQLARKVGEQLREVTFGEADLEIALKDPVNLVTKWDLWSEQTIIEGIRNQYPSHTLVGEESVSTLLAERSVTMEELLSSGICWVIDPIDGTTNFSNRIPHYGVSIGVIVDGVPSVGVVYEPCRDEMFTAVKGQGAFLNSRRIKTTNKERLLSSVVATGFPYDRASVWHEREAAFKRALLACRDLRRWGAASLDICYVAAGRFDAYFEEGVNPWDICGGHVIMAEAGGRFRDFKNPPGSPFTFSCSAYACGSGNSFSELIQTLQE